MSTASPSSRPPDRVPPWLVVVVTAVVAACWIIPIVFIARALLNR